MKITKALQLLIALALVVAIICNGYRIEVGMVIALGVAVWALFAHHILK